jgi:hypothetical protein
MQHIQLMNTEQLVQAGAVGIAILLIGVLYFIIRWLCNFIASHLERNTVALTQNTKVTAELRGVIRELNIYLKKKNGG